MYTDYRVYEHPILNRRVVKVGFSWPAMIVGPFWLLVKRQWLPAAALFLLAFALYAVLERSYQSIDIFLFGQTFGDWWRDYGTLAERIEFADHIPEERIQRWEYTKFLLTLIANFVVAMVGPRLVERDLIARGYTARSVVRARTMDEALGLLALREFPPTSPASTS